MAHIEKKSLKVEKVEMGTVIVKKNHCYKIKFLFLELDLEELNDF